MPLDRDLLQDCINHLMPFFNTTPDERQALVSIALFGSPVLENDIVWTGKPLTFTFNLVNKLHFHDDTTSLVLLLDSLQADVGEPRKSQLNSLIAQLGASSASKPITYADSETLPTPELSSASTTDGEVFISYARLNLDFVNRLRGDFQREKISYWIDKEGLSVGTKNWERSIRQAIQDCTSVVWVVSPASYASDYVDSEIAIAEAYDKIIYPVWADGDRWVDCVPIGKTKIQYVDMRGDKYTVGLVELLAALRGTRPDLEIEPEPIPIVADPQNPYKGLQAFQEADAGKFFGREALVTRLIDRLNTQLTEDKPRFLAVVGPSGAGKSSVVMAGMIPALKDNKIAGSKTWAYIPRIVPGIHPIENLSDALDDVLDDSLANIETNLLAGDRMLHRMVKKHASDYVVLYIDQFEELFTLTADENERQQFINLITSVATEPDGKLIVLLSMRADFFGHPLNYPALGRLTRDHNEAVLPMSIAELRDAIVKPAHLPTAGLHFDAGLVAEIIFALRGRDQALAGALPLLQFTLERLFEERAGNRLTQTAYDDMGGVDGAIGSHSETVFAKLPEASQKMLGQVFLPLVNIDEATGEPTRRRVDVKALKPDPDADALISAFIDARLLQTGIDKAPLPEGEAGVRANEGVYLEIAHEALFRSWERLKNWIDSVRGDLHLLREMRKAAHTWDESGRSRDFLWLGERGQEVADMLERLHPDLNDVEKAFARPEAEHLLDEIDDSATLPPRRSEISTRLHQLKYTLSGAGVKPSPLAPLPQGEGNYMIPDIAWCDVHVPDGASIEIEGKPFAIEPFQMSKYLVTYEQFQAFVDHPNGFKNLEWWRDFPEKYQPQELSDARQPYINYPRDSVSWYQAVAFCRWLTYEYREAGLLPSPQTPLKPSSPALLPQGEGSVRIREMAREAMVHIARDLRQRQTPAEEILWECLRDRRLANIKFRRQHPVANTNYVVDFFSYEHKLVVELDGGIHKIQQVADAQRQSDLEALGLQVIRFTNEQVYRQLQDTLASIVKAVESPFSLRDISLSQTNSPLPEGEGLGVRAKDWQIRLPIEWEWQWVAQNGSKANEYPWGDDFDKTYCNTSESGIGRSTAVGMFPHGATESGTLDMSGNLREWCLNQYQTPENITVDASGESRVLRGGSFYFSNISARASYRDDYRPNYRGYDYGFRVVVSPILKAVDR